MRARIKTFQSITLLIGCAIAFGGCNDLTTNALSPLQVKAGSGSAACPDANLHETAQDCPWAQASRDTNDTSNFMRLREILDRDIPGFMNEIDRDGNSKDLLNLWGLSSNVDVSNLATGLRTVPANLLQFFVSIWQVPYTADFRQGHAGINHTYGYLFSNVWTPYGFKRARYVQGELESGFGISAGMFGGLPSQGTLLSNITYFAGKIAFRDSEASMQDFEAAVSSGQIVSLPELVDYPYQSLTVKRLIETVQNPEFSLELRTDIVDFPQTNTQGADTSLLIYSLDFHLAGQESKPKLITAFPVAASFAAGVFNPANLGDQVAVSLKYNALLPVTIPASQMVGKRIIANETHSTRN